MRKLTFLLLAAAVLGACNAPQYQTTKQSDINALGDNAFGAIGVRKENDTSAYKLVLGGVTVKKELVIRSIDSNFCIEL